MSSEPDLRILVADALQGLLDHLADLFERHVKGQLDLGDFTRDAALRLIGSPGYYSATDTIVATLRTRGSPISNSSLVGDIIMEEAVPHLLESITNRSKFRPKDVWDRVVRRLESPHRLFKFSAPVSCTSELAIDLDLGGPSKLMVTHASTQSGGAKLELRGEVEELTKSEAMHRIEEHVMTLLGLSMAIGVARLLDRRTVELPTIVMDDGLPGLPMEGSVGATVACLAFVVPKDLDDVEMAQAKRGEVSRAIDNRIQCLVASMIGRSDRAIELAAAARLLFESFVAWEEGKAIAFALMSMEAALLERSGSGDIQSRLREAVAYRLGGTSEARSSLRDKVKKLYELRSRYVHTGRIDGKTDMVEEARHLACSALRRELKDATKDAPTSGRT